MSLHFEVGSEVLHSMEAFLERYSEEVVHQALHEQARTEEEYKRACLRMKFRAGTCMSLMNELMAHAINLYPSELRMLRRAGKLNTLMKQTEKSLAEHEETCTNGPSCPPHSIIDAMLFAAFADEWLVGMYAEQDDKDFRAMRAEVRRWNNWRAINAP